MTAPSLIDRLYSLRDVAETMLFAFAGGMLFGLAGMPAGYLSGSIMAVAIAALAGRPMRVPPPMMRVLLVLIGTSVGAVVTPETLRGMTTYPLSIALLIAATIAISLGGMFYLRTVHGWDRLTAYLGAVPGGLSQVMALAVEFKADVRAIAIVQTIRVIVLAVGLPALFAALGLAHAVPATVRGTFALSQSGEFVLLIGVSALVAVGAAYFRFPGGLLIGAMLASAVLHGTELLQVAVPWWVSNVALMAFGAVAGARFANTPLRLVLRFVGAAFGVFAVALAISAVFGWILLRWFDLPLAEVIVAFAPGAMEVMLLLALALNFDPVYVGAHHLTRIFFVMGVTPLIVRFRRGGGKAATVKTSADSSDD